MRIWCLHKNAFALLLVQFADPHYLRIWNYLHFVVWWIFDGSGSEDPDPGSRLIQAALEKFYYSPLVKLNQIRASLCESDPLFWIFRVFNGTVRGLKVETRIQARRSGSACPPSPWYRKKARNRHSTGLRTRHLHPDPHSIPHGKHPLLVFSLAHR